VKLSSLKKFFPGLVIAAVLFAPAPRASAQAEPSSPAAANASDGRLSTPEAQSPEKNKQEVDENDQYLHSPSVRKIGAMLGMSAEQAATAFTVGNFIVLAVLVGWFLAKTLPKTFRNRTSSIQKGLVDAVSACATGPCKSIA